MHLQADAITDSTRQPLSCARLVRCIETWLATVRKCMISCASWTAGCWPALYNAGGQLNDAHQVKIAMTNASLFAYVADGKNGLRILQLTSPETMPTYAGFSPRPQPQLIATFKTKGDALGISKALDRDRAVDESGNQIAVFGRRGARPFTSEEVQRMLRTNGGKGDYFSVSDEPTTEPVAMNSGGQLRSELILGIVFGFLAVAASYGRGRTARKGSGGAECV